LKGGCSQRAESGLNSRLHNYLPEHMSTTTDAKSKVDRLIELDRYLQTTEAPDAPDGWVPYRMTADGKVEAGKHIEGVGHVSAGFEAVGVWTEIAAHLKNMQSLGTCLALCQTPSLTTT
ncbi:MAG: hypothetical protein ACREAO_00510, partial [Nitrososphaera sp.]